MMIVDEQDIDLLEGGQLEPQNMRLLALKRRLRSQAFFRQAKVDEIEAQIKYNSPSVKTLWFGIQFQPDSQASMLYPAFFLIRRLVFAALLIFGPQFAYWQIAILMYFSFAIVLVLLTRSIWKDKLITKMHLVNESIFITLCASQICFFPGAFPEAAKASSLVRGIFIIILVSAFIIFNLVCIVRDALNGWYGLHMKRRQNIIDFRIKNRHKRVLINKRNIQMSKKLDEILR